MGRRRFEELPGYFRNVDAAVSRGLDRKARAAHRAGKEVAVRATRVDTGAARSNWITSLGTPSNRVIPPYAPGKGLGIGEVANAEGAISQGQREVTRFRARLHGSIFITNSVPYIGKLNNGTSRRAGDMMLERGAQAARQEARLVPLLSGLSGRIPTERR